MGRAWRLTAAESAALSSAVWHLGSTSARLWHDDLLQAGRIALWLTSEARDRDDKSDAYTVARRAALDELRTVTHHRRSVWSYEPPPGIHFDTPEALLEAFQSAQLLDRTSQRFRGAVARLT